MYSIVQADAESRGFLYWPAKHDSHLTRALPPIWPTTMTNQQKWTSNDVHFSFCLLQSSAQDVDNPSRAELLPGVGDVCANNLQPAGW